MNHKIHDPVSFLTNLVTRKGKSDLFGVYLTGITVSAEATVDYGYGKDRSLALQKIKSCFSSDRGDWNSLLVETRTDTSEIVFPISFFVGREPVTVYFLTEDHDMSCLVFIPKLVIDEFASEVTFYQELLKEVAAFAGKSPSIVKFTIGVVSTDWDDLVERGVAREVDVGF
jgi:hypothetical protein